jgi:hypothetical protein
VIIRIQNLLIDFPPSSDWFVALRKTVS